jgi:hypothetical protein
MSPAKRDAKQQVNARQRRRLHAQERLAHDRCQAQHAATNVTLGRLQKQYEDLQKGCCDITW